MVDINGWTVEEADRSPSFTINNGGPLNICGGCYLVLGINDDTTANGGVTVHYDYNTWSLNNGSDSIVLRDGMMR